VVHPLIATHLASWCNEEFGLKVALWIEQAKNEIQQVKNEWEHEIKNMTPSKYNDNDIEYKIKIKLAKELGGTPEVLTLHGYADIVTQNEIIEIKNAEDYKHAIGQILSYAQAFEHLNKRIHLFHEDVDILCESIIKAESVCQKYGIKITYEVVNYNTTDNTPLLEQDKQIKEFVHPIKEFIDKYCEIGEDTPQNMYRVTTKSLYELYTENYNMSQTIYPQICEREFNKYLSEVLKFKCKPCNWTYKTYLSWINLRLINEPVTQIQNIIVDFVEICCVRGEYYYEDTKVLYDTFEQYAKQLGHCITKYNGFSRQNFKNKLLDIYLNIYIKKWGVNGKKHAFYGIKLKNTINDIDVVQCFVNERCVQIIGSRIKNTDLWTAFTQYTKDKKYDIHLSREKLYDLFAIINPLIVAKNVSRGCKGFVGIALRNEPTNTQGLPSQPLESQ
jgi:hypothetical protein